MTMNRTMERRGACLDTATVLRVQMYPVAPVAYRVIFEPGTGQFREFEPPRVHTRVNSCFFFLVHQLTCGKRESVS